MIGSLNMEAWLTTQNAGHKTKKVISEQTKRRQIEVKKIDE